MATKSKSKTKGRRPQRNAAQSAAQEDEQKKVEIMEQLDAFGIEYEGHESLSTLQSLLNQEMGTGTAVKIEGNKTPSKNRSPQVTRQKQEYILEILKERGDESMPISKLQELVKAKFGTAIAQPKAKEAIEAYRNDQPLPEPGRRGRRSSSGPMPGGKILVGALTAENGENQVDPNTLRNLAVFANTDVSGAKSHIIKLIAEGISADQIVAFQQVAVETNVSVNL